MTRGYVLITAVCAAAILSACTAPAVREGAGASSAPVSADRTAAHYHKLTQAEAKDRMDAGGVKILDVRTAEEFADTHIRDAVNLPNESIRTGGEIPALLPDQDETILVYCRTGVRSRQASEKLAAMGYTNVYDIGGIVDWPYETVKGED